MSEGFGYPRPMEYQSTQFRAANFVLENEPGDELLRPPSVDRETILKLSLQEVKEQFPKRYEMYVNLLRELKHPDNEDGPVNLTSKDVEDMKKWLLALNSVDNYIARHRSPKEGDEITLRGERQVDVFDDIRKFLERNGKEGYLKLPTGFGKTVLFTELVEATNLKTLVVVPTKILIHQTTDKFKKFAPNMAVGKVFGDEKDFDQQTTIITYDSLINALKDGTLNPKDYDMVILDEAHVITAEGRAEAVAQFPDAVKIGFTATPVYKPGEKEVSNVLGTEIHRLNIREAVEGNYLSSFTSIIARTEVDLSKVRVTSSGDFDQEQLDKAVNIKGRNQAAVDLYRVGFDGKMAVTYCVSIKHAKAVSDLFNEAGISAAYISGETPDKEQEQILADYKSGKIKVLCNADILVAGFDEQQASVCFNLRPTKSIVVAEQRGGRVLRIDDNDPNKHAYIIDFLDQGVEKTGQVLFPQVAEAIELYPKGEARPNGPRPPKGPPGPRVDLDKIKIEGIEVVVDQEVMLEILAKLKTKEKIEKIEKIKDLNLLKETIIKSRIKPTSNYRKDYRDACKLNPSWPTQPEQLSGWINWADLWGIKRDKKLLAPKDIERVQDISVLKEAIKASGIQPGASYSRSYFEARKIHPEWPARADHLAGFVSYPDLWGAKEVKTITDLMTLKEAIKASGIQPSTDYARSYADARKIHKNWPAHPQRLDGFKNIADLWGVKKELINDLSKLKEAIKTSGIKPGAGLQESYNKARVNNRSWPSNPELLSGWINYADLWGVKAKSELIKDMANLKMRIQESGIKPGSSLAPSYHEARKIYPEWPSAPHKLDGWVSWADLWGLK